MGNSTEKGHFYYCELAEKYFLNLRLLTVNSVQVQLLRMVCDEKHLLRVDPLTSTGR